MTIPFAILVLLILGGLWLYEREMRRIERRLRMGKQLEAACRKSVRAQLPKKAA